MHRRAFIRYTALATPALGLTAPIAGRAQESTIEPPPCDTDCPDQTPVGDQVDIRSHRVDVTIVDQVATTNIDQVFHNPNDWVAEGTWIFPIPDGATISRSRPSNGVRATGSGIGRRGNRGETLIELVALQNEGSPGGLVSEAGART